MRRSYALPVLLVALLFSGHSLFAGPKKKNPPQSPVSMEDYAAGAYRPITADGIKMFEEGKWTQLDYDRNNLSTVVIRRDFEREMVDTIFNSAFAEGFPQRTFADGYAVSDDGNYLMFSAESETKYRHSKRSIYYVYSLRKNKTKKIFNGEKISDCTFSPDNSRVAFIYKNNLYIQNFKTDEIVQITRDGAENKIINGMADWVYEEEFGLTHAYAWSPKGTKLAWQRFDESMVPEYDLTLYHPDSIYPQVMRYKYPKAGERNSTVGVYVYNLASNKITKLNVGEQNDQYIPRIQWTRDDNTLTYMRLNRRQNKLTMFAVDLRQGNSRVLFEDENNSFIDLPEAPYFLSDNSFIISSERTGFNNFFLVDKEGTIVRNLTNFQHDADKLIAVDEKAKRFYYTSFEPTPLYTSVYVNGLDGVGREMLSREWQRGTNMAYISPDFRYYLLVSSSTMSPETVMAFKNDGFKLRDVELNNELREKIKTLIISPKEELKFKLSSDVELNGWIIRPKDYNPRKKYPVIFTVYGGPGKNTVTNEFDYQDFWYQHLAAKGYIIVSVDPHGTGRRGADFKRATYKRLGILESDEFIACAKYLAEQFSYVDPKRIAIFGWSYGGFMSAACITKGENTFKCAVAVAPVTDWRYYDNIYTERYMQTPRENPDGYKQTSILQHVPKMTGKLLLIHGTADDNVHPQNSMVFIDRLISEQKNFDSEFYPNRNHGIYGGVTRLQLWNRINTYFAKNL